MRALVITMVAGCAFSPMPVGDPPPPAGDGSGSGSGSGADPMPQPPPSPRASFALVQDGAAWRFEVGDASGTKLLASADYADRIGAIGGVLWTFDHGGDSARYAVAADDVVALVAANNHTMATSDPHASLTEANAAIDATIASIDGYLTTPRTGARFVVATDARFEVHDASDAVVLTSETYSSLAAAYNGAFAAQADGADPTSYTIGGDHAVTLVAPNGQILATTAPYASDAAAQDAIDQLAAMLPALSVF